MDISFSAIQENFEKNITDIEQLVEFDKIILDFAIKGVGDLHLKLKGGGFDNVSFNANNTLKMLERIQENDSLRPKYQAIFNQCVVLQVSVFASAVAEIFRSAIDYTVNTDLSDSIKKEELKFSIRELADYEYNLEGRIGRLISERSDVSFQDMKSIGRVFYKYFNFEIDKDDDVNNIIMAQAARHVIVHDASLISLRLINQVKGANPRKLKKSC